MKKFSEYINENSKYEFDDLVTQIYSYNAQSYSSVDINIVVGGNSDWSKYDILEHIKETQKSGNRHDDTEYLEYGSGKKLKYNDNIIIISIEQEYNGLKTTTKEKNKTSVTILKGVAPNKQLLKKILNGFYKKYDDVFLEEPIYDFNLNVSINKNIKKRTRMK